MKYTYIAVTIAVIAVITFITIFIIRSDEAKKIRDLFKRFVKVVSPDPTSIHISDKSSENNENNQHHANSWIVKVVSDNNIVAQGDFLKETFDVSPADEREKHYSIGFFGSCDLHINPTDIEGHGELAYIRYDRDKKAYYLWDTGMIASIFSDSECIHPIEKQNVKITDGLELFFSVNSSCYSLRFTFVKD